MGIVRNQPGSSSLAAGAGSIIGTAKKKEAEHEQKMQADRMAAQLAGQQMAIKARQQQQEAALKWEQKKMEERSRQAFDQEQMDRQWEMEKINAAKAWDIEKMTLNSQEKYTEEANERRRLKDEARSGLAELDKRGPNGNGQMTEEEAAPLRKRLEMQLAMGAKVGAGDIDYVSPYEKEKRGWEQQRFDAWKVSQTRGTEEWKQAQEDRAEAKKLRDMKLEWTLEDRDALNEERGYRLTDREWELEKREHTRSLQEAWKEDRPLDRELKERRVEDKATFAERMKAREFLKESFEVPAKFWRTKAGEIKSHEAGISKMEKAMRIDAVKVLFPNLPVPVSQADFDAIPSGSNFIDSSGNIRTKP